MSPAATAKAATPATPATSGAKTPAPAYVATTNACKLCKPMGAALAFKGIEGCVPFLHGSQGCATYMRRYIISHFREPVDIASSALGEKHAVYGGAPNLKKGIINVMQKYGAQVVGVASTCLTETIGDDMPMIVREFKQEFADLDLPEIITVSTPSYGGTHMEGFTAAVRETVRTLAQGGPREDHVTILPGFVSPADIRHVKELAAAYRVPAVVLPDYSETLDGPAWDDYLKLPPGGTPVAAIRSTGRSAGVLECGRTLDPCQTAGGFLHERFQVPLRSLGIPIGLRETDAFCDALTEFSGHEMPHEVELERGRLVDALVDAHKYISGQKAVVYGECDLVVGLVALLSEIGVQTVLAATGATSGRLAQAMEQVCGDILPEPPIVRQGVDFYEIANLAEELAPDLVVGSSKGYRVISKELGVPLIRVGFPIHDRFGAQRTLHVGYRGALSLLDTITNAVIEKKQTDSDIGYGYI